MAHLKFSSKAPKLVEPALSLKRLGKLGKINFEIVTCLFHVIISQHFVSSRLN